ncbi:MAG: hypothetical protein M1829_006181 [Trizodia sp. TS-e1964]|nr:MAG: hypothetical protein M1829_006181 [Trizodia sp. TS-e1964]
MLDEERLVPTNCMRACTSVVTELSYNESANPAQKYRAEIDFISAADWEKELQVLFQELIDSNGNISRDCTNQETEAGVAYAKIKAVYYKMKKDDLAQSTVQKLMAEPMVKNLFGTTRRIASSNSQEFYCRVQHYVDSSEKSTGKANDGAKKKKKKRMEFWPLIRVVKIYTKADALATGAVVVDLPGVHDSNAARAAVAQGYIKQCTGLWIVAPINRAVDDKAAKTLLGDSFKRQLKMDGGYSAVSFICSKTDDINVNEASDSLGIKRRIENLWVQADECEENAKKFKKQQSELKDQKKCYGDVMEQMEEEIEAWEMLGERLEKGETVCRPDTGKKRKRSPNEHLDANKRRRGSDSKNSTAQEDEKNAENADHDEGQPTEAAEPLTEEQIDAQIADFKSKKKKSRQERALLEAKLKDIEGEAAKSKTLQTNIEASIRALCIEGRNSYSKGAIQQDFAAGIKELDQENADEDDEENFNPDEDIRDYEEVARHLPVFCCSSRAYQRLMGRFKKEPDVPGFTTIEQTQIPDLQAHCRKLTEAGRSANCKRFLNSLSQLLNSMTLWAGNDKSGANLTPEQKLKEEASLAVNLQKLEEALESNVTSSIKAIRAELEADIFDQFNLAVISSSEQALPTAQKWGFKVNKDDRAAGGYYWATYKAICRRGGVYANPQGSHDFNLFLAEPIVRVLAGGWERCFTRSIPKVYRNFTRSSSESLHKFHSRAEQRSRAAGLNLVGLGLLQQQLQVYENTLNNIGSLMTDQINKQQREINREFTPVIARHMLEAYEGCVAQCGPGSFARMKTLMENHVTAQRITMFHASTQTVHKLLMAMVAQVEEATLNEVEGLLVNLRRDYQTVVGGALLPAGEMLPRHERHLRTDVREILDDYKDTWSNLLEASAENDHKDGNAPAPSDLAGDNRSFEFENFLDDGDFINYNDEEDDAEDNNNEGANKKQAPINFVNDDEEIDAF